MMPGPGDLLVGEYNLAEGTGHTYILWLGETKETERFAAILSIYRKDGKTYLHCGVAEALVGDAQAYPQAMQWVSSTTTAVIGTFAVKAPYYKTPPLPGV